MIKAGFLKEWQLTARTGRFIGILIAFLAFSLIDPISIKVMMPFAEFYDSIIGELSEATGAAIDISMVSLMEAAYGSSPAASMGLAQAMVSFSGTSMIIIFFVLMLPAGGEQKKRSTIIPGTAGLSLFAYALPKFVLYPCIGFVTAVLAMLLAGGVSSVLFVNDLALSAVLLGGVFLGVQVAFYVCLLLCIGVCTGRGGLAAIVCFVASMFLPSILSMFGVADKFNPFAWTYFAQAAALGSLESYSSANLVGTGVVTAILLVLLFVLTLFVQTARRVDNSGNDLLL